MKIKNVIFYLFFILLLIQKIVLCQKESVQFEHLTIDEGLSQSSVRTIYKDKTGFMWFGTKDGLNRYDGYEFKIFKNDIHDSTSISNDDIYDIAEDSSNNLWIATSDGLSCYDPLTELFKRYNFSGRIDDITFSNAILSVLTSGLGDERNIWFTTRNGIFKYSLEEDRLILYKIPSEEFSVKIDRKIFLSMNSNGDIIAVTNMEGIYKLEKNENIFINLFEGYAKEINNNAQLTPIYEDDDNILWFGSINGLNKYDPFTGKIEFYKTQFEEAVGKKFSTSFINCITNDDENSLWIATSGFGLINFNKITEDIKVYSHNPYDERTINLDVIHTILKDETGLLWIGTDGKGIDILNPYLNNFNYIAQTEGGLRFNSVRTIFEDAENNIWVSGYTGLNRYNPDTGIYEDLYSISGNKKDHSISDVVYTIIEDINKPERFLYLGTEGSGLYKYNIQKEEFNPIFFSNSNPGDNIILSLYDDGSGSLWIGTNNSLIKFEKKSGNYIRYVNNPDDPFSIRPQMVTAIYEDSYNNFWIGTNQGGLNLMNKQEGTFTSYNIYENYNDEKEKKRGNEGLISGNFVKCIYEDKNRNLWIGTTKGLNKLIRTTNSFKKYSIDDGLPNNVIYGILEDEEGNLWSSTNFGLSKFNPVQETFKNYDYRDGLQSNEFNSNAYYKTEKGIMFFGGINGLNSFRPDKIKENRNIPKLIITDFRLFNKSIVINENYYGRKLLTRTIVETASIELNYQENVFTIEYSALDYSSSGKNMYSHLLEGFDTEWSIPSDSRTVTYTNLDPGEYVFNVIASNNDGLWNKKGTQLTIIINPPFWLTWWFYLLIVAVIAAIIYLAFRIKISKVLEIERLRTNIASDLHDDIGSTLTKISMQAELMEQGIDSENRQKNLSRISEMSRGVIGTMQDIIWSIDSRNDTFKDLELKMKDTVHSLLIEKGIKVEFVIKDFDLSHEASQVFRQNVYLIMKEAVHNISKHSNADSVSITLMKEDNNFKMIIYDNGSDIDEDKYIVGQGLKNMKMRAAKIKGDIEYDKSDGFKIILSCPML